MSLGFNLAPVAAIPQLILLVAYLLSGATLWLGFVVLGGLNAWKNGPGPSCKNSSLAECRRTLTYGALQGRVGSRLWDPEWSTIPRVGLGFRVQG